MDYDDWSCPNEVFHGLNGDILIWNEVTHSAFELSSMGIRVDNQVLMTQSAITGQPITSQYHSMVLQNTIPLSIGGGIGQSRLCMFLLEKRHIGEVRVSEWPEDMREKCQAQGIKLF
jgi:aspartate--ammonia ligase